ncbi:hypothetical protein V6Z12_D03G034900 [Gossypium hirsutum]
MRFPIENGISPTRFAFVNHKYSSFDKFPISSGNGLGLKGLYPSAKSVNSVRLPRKEGTFPLSRFPPSERTLRDFIRPKLTGISPVKLLLESSRTSKCSDEKSGNSPTNMLPERSIFRRRKHGEIA